MISNNDNTSVSAAHKRKYMKSAGLALLAALLYGISAPASKVLLNDIPPTMMAALLYLGAGSGMLVVKLIQVSTGKSSSEARLMRQELPYTIAMVVLDIAAPILLMLGLQRTTSANASLLNNFEIVATSLIALLVFKEAIGRRMWLAIGLVTTASILLSINTKDSLSFSFGSVLVLLAAVCWGLENNCTRVLSKKDPLQIVVIKGLGSGLGSLFIAFLRNETVTNKIAIALALLLGFVAYGLSIFFYIRAQRDLGAARTSAYYAAAPFIGVVLSWILLREAISGIFLTALFVMLVGMYFALSEKHTQD